MSTTPEREITEPVPLIGPDGRLNPEAVGYSRQPVHDTSGLRRGWRGRGRNKRWEYWAVMTPTHIVALTIADLDYAALHSVWMLDRATLEPSECIAIRPLGRGTTLPSSLGDGPAQARGRRVSIDMEDTPTGTHLRASAPGLAVDVFAALPEGHERLCVVVPWSASRFQYTVKDVARPASGSLRIGDERVELVDGEAWAVLDHGRGRWPYALTWNWGAASGRSDGHVIGVQLGGKWTEGTGSTENGLLVDGRLHKIGEQLVWDYDLADTSRPWTIRGRRVDLHFTPFYDRTAHIELGVFATHQHQCFGRYDGWMADDTGERVRIDGVEGWAEDVRNRW